MTEPDFARQVNTEPVASHGKLNSIHVMPSLFSSCCMCAMVLLEAPCCYTHLVSSFLKKSLLSKLQGSAFTRTVTTVTVTVPGSTITSLFHPYCKPHVRYPCMICLTRYVTAVIVTGHHDCIMPLQNSVAAAKQQP